MINNNLLKNNRAAVVFNNVGFFLGF